MNGPARQLAAAALSLGLCASAFAASNGARTDSSQEPDGYTPMAQQLLAAAKLRLAQQQQQQAQQSSQTAARARAEQVKKARQLAEQLSQEKSKRRELQERESQHQLQVVREQRLKQLYSQAVSLYQRGAYQDAVQLLQQMTVMDPSIRS